MARLWCAMLLCAMLAPAANLQVVRAAISDSDGGPPNPPDSEYRPGDLLYFTCRVAGFAKDNNDQVRLAYTVQPADPHGVALAELSKNSIAVEVMPQDKNWLPKIESTISLPTELFSGEYKIAVKVEDLIAKTSAALEVPFRVRGRDDLHPGDALAVEAFRFLRNEDDTKPAERAAYIPGDHLWARFDITGFRYGPNNRIDVSYLTSVLRADGTTLWTQPQPETAQGESFYPRPFVPAEMGIELQPTIRPGAYTLVIEAKDAIGKQTCEIREQFTIEKP